MALYLLDTGVVLRFFDQTSAEHPECRDAAQTLTAAGHTVLLAPQVIYEFWVVGTRPAANRGFGWPAARAAQGVKQLLDSFSLYPETPDVFNNWQTLVEQRSVIGKRAHDVRIVAFKEAHRVSYLVTLNRSDFLGLTSGVLSPQEAKESA